ncbi:MAG: hypothetical protein KDA17_04355 [Candidatus Saccharibacteria bacterium]|nr:hypothetical protein [Candidatus Saccharibacteria bacterium]
MPVLYENARGNFANFDHFKEVATKTLNEIYGRVRPLDVVDFFQTATTYKAVGYYDTETIPDSQPDGAPISDASAEAERTAREQQIANEKIAAEEAAAEELRIRAAFTAKQPVSYEDLVLANRLGIPLPEEIAVQLEQGVKEGRFSFEAAHVAGLTHIDGVPTLEAAKNYLYQAIVNQNNEAAESPLPEQQEDTDAPPPPPEIKELPYGVKGVGDKTISDKALELALTKNLDISKIEGTGRDGTIKVSDVKDYIANNAPATENADDNSNEQSDA